MGFFDWVGGIANDIVDWQAEVVEGTLNLVTGGASRNLLNSKGFGKVIDSLDLGKAADELSRAVDDRNKLDAKINANREQNGLPPLPEGPGFWGQFLGAVGEGVSQGWNSALKGIDDAISGTIKAFFDDPWGFITLKGLRSFVSNLWNDWDGTWKAVGSAISDAWNKDPSRFLGNIAGQALIAALAGQALSKLPALKVPEIPLPLGPGGGGALAGGPVIPLVPPAAAIGGWVIPLVPDVGAAGALALECPIQRMDAPKNPFQDGGQGIESHHNLPQKFKQFFEDAGLDIEEYTEPMPVELHRLHPDGLHTGVEHWNELWEQFIFNNEAASAEQILEFLNEIRALKGLPPW